MSKDHERFDAIEKDGGGYVPAVVARSAADAEKYLELMDDHGIPAILADDESIANGNDEEVGARRKPSRGGMTRGVPVLVPEAMLDEASEVIAEREDLDEFDPTEDGARSDDEDDDEEFGLHEAIDLADQGDLEEEDDEDDLGLDEDEDEEEEV